MEKISGRSGKDKRNIRGEGKLDGNILKKSGKIICMDLIY